MTGGRKLPRDPRCPIGWGNASGYSNHKCRCEWCRAGWAERIARARDRRAAEAGGGHPFGKPFNVGTYTNYGCRCRWCTEAMSRDHAQYYQARKAAS